jgi:dephospho-CoA kinase
MHISTSAYHPIFLIGYSGVGKTYWGKLWSELSGLTFYDLDDMVEEQNEKTISEIFASDGEEHFRNLETAALRTFVNSKNVIVATEWCNCLFTIIGCKYFKKTGRRKRKETIDKRSQRRGTAFLHLRKNKRERNILQTGNDHFKH